MEKSTKPVQFGRECSNYLNCLLHKILSLKPCFTSATIFKSGSRKSVEIWIASVFYPTQSLKLTINSFNGFLHFNFQGNYSESKFDWMVCKKRRQKDHFLLLTWLPKDLKIIWIVEESSLALKKSYSNMHDNIQKNKKQKTNTQRCNASHLLRSDIHQSVWKWWTKCL